MEAQNLEGKVDQKADGGSQGVGSILKRMLTRTQKVRNQIDPTATAEPTRKDDDSLENQRLYSTN